MTDLRADSQYCSRNAAAVVESAEGFGLADEEILEAVTEALDHLPGALRALCIDELAGALAVRVLEKQRGF